MKYFTVHEFERSNIATTLQIDNTIRSGDVLKNIKCLVNNVLDPLREYVQMPIRVTSGYRCKELNLAVGGTKRSYHISGQAADITCRNCCYMMYEYIRLNLPYTELIWYKKRGFVHVAFDVSYKGHKACKIVS